MILSIEESRLFKLTNARSVAFLGASSRPTSMGSSILTSLLASGFKGKVYPLHPKEKKVNGLEAYERAIDLPEVPDLVIIVLPTAIVCQAMEECGQAGIRQAIVVSGGFKEVGGEGSVLEAELKEIVQRHGITMIGPNCLGIANLHQNLNSTPLSLDCAPGFVGLVSQSGSFVTQMFNYLERLNLGFSTAFSVGNEADVDIIDCLEYLAVCPHTKVIALYLEGIKRGQAFIETVKKISVKKPIVAVYIGGSEAGRNAAFSHTGSMSGPDILYDGVFQQCGIIRAYSITELFDICWALAVLPRPQGDRVVIQTHSGGPGACAADACSREGFHLPPLSSQTEKELEPFLPQMASTKNPVDLTFTQNPAEYFFNIPEVLLKETVVDYLLIYIMIPESTIRSRLQEMGMSQEKTEKTLMDIAQFAEQSILSLRDAHNKPIVGFTYRSLDEYLVKRLIKQGVPVYPDPSRAARAMKSISDYYKTKEALST